MPHDHGWSYYYDHHDLSYATYELTAILWFILIIGLFFTACNYRDE